MTFGDALGWAACMMTLVTFAQRRMVPLRVAAILANFFFIGYSALGHYLPVLALHLTLLPVNGQRLFSQLAANRSKQRPGSVAIGTAQLGHERIDGPGRSIRRLVRAAVNGSLPSAVNHLIGSRSRTGFGGRQ